MANLKGINFLSNGRINMDTSDCFAVSKFIATVVAKKIGKRVEADVASDRKFIRLNGADAKMNIYTGEVKLDTPERVNARKVATNVTIWNVYEKAKKIFGEDVSYCNILQKFYIPSSFFNSPTCVGEYKKEDKRIVKWDIRYNISTGYEDTRSYENRKKELMTNWQSGQLVAKSRRGFGAGQNYIGGNFFNPCTNCLTRDRGVRFKEINFKFYESWLGEVGQLEKMPYKGHKLMPKKMLLLLQKCSNKHKVADFVCKNWKEIFTKEEVESIYARLNL